MLPRMPAPFRDPERGKAVERLDSRGRIRSGEGDPRKQRGTVLSK
jgi:hypothetical protein